MLKLAKSQRNTKQHLEVELMLFENYSHSSSTYSSKINRAYSKKYVKNKCTCIHEIIRLTKMKMKMKMKEDRIDTTKINLVLDIDINLVNIKSV